MALEPKGKLAERGREAVQIVVVVCFVDKKAQGRLGSGETVSAGRGGAFGQSGWASKC